MQTSAKENVKCIFPLLLEGIEFSGEYLLRQTLFMEAKRKMKRKEEEERKEERKEEEEKEEESIEVSLSFVSFLSIYPPRLPLLSFFLFLFLSFSFFLRRCCVPSHFVSPSEKPFYDVMSRSSV